MSLFGSNESYLGVDIANSALKVVELQNDKGRPKLLTYGYLEQENKILTSDSKETREAIISALQRVREAARTTSTNAIAALPSYTVFTSIIHLPEMSKKELTAAVQWEAKKFVPMPLEEMILDWKILADSDISTQFSANPSVGISPATNMTPGQPMAGMNQMPGMPVQQPGMPQAYPNTLSGGAGAQQPATITSKEKKKFLKILLTAAPKNLVTRYVEIFKEAKLNLVSLETESFALERSLIGNDKSPIMIIDIGAVATTISVVVDSVPLINRSIDIGGRTITKAIANSLNIDMERAEQFKRDFGLAQQAADSGSGGQIPKRIEFMVASIINEIKYVLNLYQNQGNLGIEKIILAGGSAWLPNITQYLHQVLNMKVYIGDPWARVMYPVDLKPILQTIGPRLAVATGLAMREIS
ncbi:MAG: pilus assembly protein PilM [Candidatus Kerfeldbacteria bacterium]|nr:pilus assembly protein PilM [Candidatus Kerfeldbacteria bacterium]